MNSRVHLHKTKQLRISLQSSVSGESRCDENQQQKKSQQDSKSLNASFPTSPRILYTRPFVPAVQHQSLHIIHFTKYLHICTVKATLNVSIFIETIPKSGEEETP